jgi:surface antigen Omp85-like protein/surface antigen-like variable number repeat protein
MKWALVVLALALSTPAAAQDPPAPPHPEQVLGELRLEGATVFTRDDVLWLLKLREGSPLPQPPEDVAKALQERYDRDGYSEARVGASFDQGRLTLTVDEGRIDEIQIVGVSAEEAARFTKRLQIQPGDIYNKRVVGRATRQLIDDSDGAFQIGHPRRRQPGHAESGPDEVVLERRGSRNVLVIPLRWRTTDTDPIFGSGREDLYSPVDGASLALGFGTTIFDHRKFNHTYVNGYASYKFSRDDPGYSAGIERPIFGGPKLFLGGEIHDVTASDDLWRLTTGEQALVALGFKNSFRDYYRRRGQQVFTVFRAGANNEFSAMARWDRHEPLPNVTDYSFFRDDAAFRPNPLVLDQHVNTLVFGYTFDTRELSGAGQQSTYERHLKDSLFGSWVRQSPGLRIEWTSEIAGHGMGGDAEFDRHIFNTRGYLPLGPRTLLSGRALFGFSNGTLPIERQFAIGGIGTVHGYSFKEASGTDLTLLNAEYRVNLTSPIGRDKDGFGVFAFYDAGRVSSPRTPAPPWQNGVGFGFGGGGLRLEFGYRASDIPGSLQVLVRFSPTF